MNFLYPSWPAPNNVFALTTTRHHGCSVSPFDTNNLALHVEDNLEHVIQNRQQLKQYLSLPDDPMWLNQTHSTHCVVVEENDNRDADASITRKASRVLSIMTADCLPIVLCNRQGTEVAAIHAGWRGLLDGVIQTTIEKMKSAHHDLIAWIGPAICQNCYEVGEEVKTQFLCNYPHAEIFFSPRRDKYLIDIAGIAEQTLKHLNISEVYKSNICTFEEKNDFFSYRRSGKTGRMATLIWFKE